jgi:hypothetical protein
MLYDEAGFLIGVFWSCTMTHRPSWRAKTRVREVAALDGAQVLVERLAERHDSLLGRRRDGGAGGL